MQDFRRLQVWQKAHALTLAVHRVVERLPRGGYAGLRSQILRASASVPANIAEGCGHRSDRELVRFVDMAIASITELQYHLILARDLSLVSTKVHGELDDALVEVRRMLHGFSSAIRQAAPPADR